MKKIALFVALAIGCVTFFSACSKDDDKDFDVASCYGNYTATQKGSISVNMGTQPMVIPITDMQTAFVISPGAATGQIIKLTSYVTEPLKGSVDSKGNATFEDENVNLSEMLAQLPLQSLVPAEMLPMIQAMTGTVVSKTTGTFSNNQFTYNINMNGTVSVQGIADNIPVTVVLSATANK